jgi:uncharacterized protein (TIGR02596 family)
MIRPSRCRTGARAFTITELLVVVAIMVILATMSIPALHSLLPASQLAQASQMMENSFAYARQTALARNALVEVRFYKMADPEKPSDPSKYRAFQAFVYDDTGRATPLEKVQYLPNLIIADSNGTLSPLLGGSQVKSWTAPDTKPPLPRVGTTYDASAFEFQPDGSTTLTVGQLWFVTVHAKNDGDNLGTLPKNYAVLQIDPVNGHVQEYRP